jgi:recombination protein RecR
MALLPPAFERLVRELTRLPGIGEKTATRLAYHLLQTERRDVDALAVALTRMRDDTRLCSVCLGLAGDDPCDLCSDPQRRRDTICIVERPSDLIALERSGGFRGRYHVLHGCLAPLDGIGPDQLRIKELFARLEGGGIEEVVVATNPTVEGDATALYLAKLIKPLGIRVTRIAHGIAVGSDVEYADSVTLGRALDGRREL